MLLFKELVEVGSDGDGPRHMEMFVPAMPHAETRNVKRGLITVAETVPARDDKGNLVPPTRLPYLIWPVSEGLHVRFRWACRHRGKPEMRVGVSTHGAAATLAAAVSACLHNHAERLQLEVDDA